MTCNDRGTMSLAGAKRITELTEKTEQTESGQETFRLFRFFRLFRNPLYSALYGYPSETVIQAELQHSTAKECACDLAELCRSNSLIAKGPGRMIEDVRCVHAKHQFVPLSDLGGLTHCEVHTEHPGGGELSSL